MAGLEFISYAYVAPFVEEALRQLLLARPELMGSHVGSNGRITTYIHIYTHNKINIIYVYMNLTAAACVSHAQFEAAISSCRPQVVLRLLNDLAVRTGQSFISAERLCSLSSLKPKINWLS